MQLRAGLMTEGKFDRSLARILGLLCRREGVEVEIEQANERLETFGTRGRLTAKVQTLVAIGQYDLLFVHRDADTERPDARRLEITSACTEAGMRVYVPIIPIQETEAWLLTDGVAIRTVVGNRNGRVPLGLPKLDEIERARRPKERLNDALDKAMVDGPRHQFRGSDKKHAHLSKLRARLLENLDIDGPVTHLSAWQALVQDTKTALAAFTATPA